MQRGETEISAERKLCTPGRNSNLGRGRDVALLFGEELRVAKIEQNEARLAESQEWTPQEAVTTPETRPNK